MTNKAKINKLIEGLVYIDQVIGVEVGALLKKEQFPSKITLRYMELTSWATKIRPAISALQDYRDETEEVSDD